MNKEPVSTEMPFFKRLLSKIGKVINVPLVLEFRDNLDSDKDFIFFV